MFPLLASFLSLVSGCTHCLETAGVHMYPEAGNGGAGGCVTKSLRATYFTASVHFVPETRIALKKTSATCQSREISCSHSSVAPIKWMLRQPSMSLDEHSPIQWSGMTFSQLQLVLRLIQQLLQRDLPGFSPANPLIREEQREERRGKTLWASAASSAAARPGSSPL